jgi:hypothetical protein
MIFSQLKIAVPINEFIIRHDQSSHQAFRFVIAR